MLKLINLPKSALMSVLILALLLGGSSGAAAVELMATQQASMSLQTAQTLYSGGDEQGAMSRLRQHVLEHPDSSNLSAAHILLARILIDQQRYADALMYLQRIASEQQTNVSQLLLVTALRYSQPTDADTMMLADSMVAKLRVDQFLGSDRQLFYLNQSILFSHQQQSMQALVVLHRALTADVAYDKLAIFNQINSVLSTLSAEDVAEAEFMFADTELNDAIILHRAEQAWLSGDKAGALQLAEQLVETAQTSAARISAASLLDEIYGGHWQRRALGVVLPLTGRYAPFGKLVRQGIELAATQTGTLSQFIFLDSSSDPEQGLQAVRSLIEGYRVVGIIGPLTGEVVQRVVAYANESQVPLLTLSHRDGLPEQGPFIFRNCLTVEQQVQALAEYAIEVLGLNTYSILYPDNDSGADFAARFRAAIEKRGGDIEYSLHFAEQGTDFRRQLLLLKGEDPDAPIDDNAAPKKEVDKSAQLGELIDGVVGAQDVVEPPARPDWLPTVDFEALFVPAYAETIALLAPQLAFYGIENVQLLGMNGWNSPMLLQQAGRYTKGAIFSDGFYLDSPAPHIADFVSQYQQNYGDKPSILEAQAYDCANIMLQLIAHPDVVSSVALAQSLSLLTDYHGVTGITGFDANGEAQREVCLVQMGRRNLQQLPSIPLIEEIPEQYPQLIWR